MTSFFQKTNTLSESCYGNFDWSVFTSSVQGMISTQHMGFLPISAGKKSLHVVCLFYTKYQLFFTSFKTTSLISP